MTDQIETAPETVDSIDTAPEGVSRRGMLLGIGAAAGAVAGAGLISGETHAASAVPRISTSLRPEAVAAPIAGLTYVSYDCLQFYGRDSSGAQSRYYDTVTGVGLMTPPGFVYCPLNLPVGSKIMQVNVGYHKQPILQIQRRSLNTPGPGDPADISTPKIIGTNLPLDAANPAAASVNFSGVEIEKGYSYVLAFYLDASTGNTIYNAEVGYTPPAAPVQQAFFPFTGPTPRVLDTREAGPLTGKLGPNEERTVDLGITGAKTAVINLTVTQTGNAGYVAVFPANITWPGNSSINWYEPNSDLANGVTVALDPTGKIKIRGGGGANTHVVIDRIGYFL